MWGNTRDNNSHLHQRESERRTNSKYRRRPAPGGVASTEQQLDKLDRSPKYGAYGRSVKASVISSGGAASNNSPFKKVRSDVNLDRSESPDMAKRLSRPRFD